MNEQTYTTSAEKFEAGKYYKIVNNDVSHHTVPIGTRFIAIKSNISNSTYTYRYNINNIVASISITEVELASNDGLVGKRCCRTPSGIVYSVFFKKEESRFITSTACYVGKIKVCEYYYDGARSKVLPPLKVISQMVGIKSELGHFNTNEEAEAKCMSVARTFVKMLHNKPE